MICKSNYYDMIELYSCHYN